MRAEPTITAAALAGRLALSLSGVQYHIKNLKALGELERLGGDRGGRWPVKD